MTPSAARFEAASSDGTRASGFGFRQSTGVCTNRARATTSSRDCVTARVSRSEAIDVQPSRQGGKQLPLGARTRRRRVAPNARPRGQRSPATPRPIGSDRRRRLIRVSRPVDGEAASELYDLSLTSGTGERHVFETITAGAAETLDLETASSKPLATSHNAAALATAAQRLAGPREFSTRPAPARQLRPRTGSVTRTGSPRRCRRRLFSGAWTRRMGSLDQAQRAPPLRSRRAPGCGAARLASGRDDSGGCSRRGPRTPGRRRGR